MDLQVRNMQCHNLFPFHLSSVLSFLYFFLFALFSVFIVPFVILASTITVILVIFFFNLFISIVCLLLLVPLIKFSQQVIRRRIFCSNLILCFISYSSDLIHRRNGRPSYAQKVLLEFSSSFICDMPLTVTYDAQPPPTKFYLRPIYGYFLK